MYYVLQKGERMRVTRALGNLKKELEAINPSFLGNQMQVNTYRYLL
jgi:hypothetical protein